MNESRQQRPRHQNQPGPTNPTIKWVRPHPITIFDDVFDFCIKRQPCYISDSLIELITERAERMPKIKPKESVDSITNMVSSLRAKGSAELHKFFPTPGGRIRDFESPDASVFDSMVVTEMLHFEALYGHGGVLVQVVFVYLGCDDAYNE